MLSTEGQCSLENEVEKMDNLPILKEWFFESETEYSKLTKDAKDKYCQDLRELEEFINSTQEKYIFTSPWRLCGKVFGHKKYPDDTGIGTSDLIELEKIEQNKLSFAEPWNNKMVATTKSGSKYIFKYQDMGGNQFVLFGMLIQKMGYL